ncbi:hypothetical protein ACG7TL_001500 [Trametes sanguinea]
MDSTSRNIAEPGLDALRTLLDDRGPTNFKAAAALVPMTLTRCVMRGTSAPAAEANRIGQPELHGFTRGAGERQTLALWRAPLVKAFS